MTDVPVSQEAREAAANFISEWSDRPNEDDYPSHTDSIWVREGKGDDEALVQAFAKFEKSIRQQAERDVIARMEPVGWRPIETAPKDGTPFLAAIWVGHNDEPRRWDMHVIGYDAAYDEMNSDFETGWEIEDYAFWQPLPTPPAGEA